MAIQDYNTSAASNTTLGTIPVGPGMERNKVNDAIQQLMADLASFYVDYKTSTSTTIERFGGGVGETAAINTSALALAIAALPAGGTVHFGTPNGTYQLSPGISITQDNIKLQGNVMATLQWATLGSGVDGLDVTGDNFQMENITLDGPGAATTFTANETLLRVEGVSAASRLQKLKLENVFFTGTGSYGLYGKWLDGVTITGGGASEVAYGAIFLLSCNNIRITGGLYDVRAAVGTASNAYGISLTHDSVGYSSNQTLNPFCNTAVIDGVTIIGPVIWQAFDTHGCDNTSLTNCKIFGARFGASLTAGSGDAANYAGRSNIAIGNVFDANYPDGTTTGIGAVARIGLILGGGSTVPHSGPIATGNVFRNYNASIDRQIDGGSYLQNAVISDNTFYAWSGIGVYLSTGCTDIIISDLVFAEPATTGAEVINWQGSHVARGSISGVMVAKGATRQPSIGVRLSLAAGSEIFAGLNGFDRCAITWLNPTGIVHGPGLPGVISVTATSGAISVDCSLVRLSLGTPLTIEFSSLSGAVTSVDLNNTQPGANIILYNKDAANTVTYTRAESALDGGANWVGGQYDTLSLLHRQTGANVFVELSRAANS